MQNSSILGILILFIIGVVLDLALVPGLKTLWPLVLFTQSCLLVNLIIETHKETVQQKTSLQVEDVRILLTQADQTLRDVNKGQMHIINNIDIINKALTQILGVKDERINR